MSTTTSLDQFISICRRFNVTITPHLLSRIEYLEKNDQASLLITPDTLTKIKARKSGETLYQTVQKKSFLTDLEDLKQILPKVYAGYTVHQERGLKWENFFSESRDHLAKKEDRMSGQDALSIFEPLLKEYPDNHLMFPFSGTHFGNLSATEIPTPPHADPQYGKEASVYKDHDITECQIWAGPQRLSKTPKNEDLLNGQRFVGFTNQSSFLLDEMQTYTYLRLPTGTAENTTAIKAAISKEVSATDKPLLIDLRFNSGMNAEPAIHLICKLCGIEGFEGVNQMLAPKILTTLQTEILSFNFDILSAICSKKDETPFTLDTDIGADTASSNIDLKPLVSKRKVICLINRRVASDGEAIVRFLKRLEDINFIGENTGGVGEFTQPGFLFLPRTQIIITPARGHRSFSHLNIERFEGVGFAPDIYLAEDSWERASIERLVKTL